MKLADFKTTLDPSISSLHFIIANMVCLEGRVANVLNNLTPIQMLSQPKVELHRMCEEMQSVPAAAKISAAALNELLSSIQEVHETWNC